MFGISMNMFIIIGVLIVAAVVAFFVYKNLFSKPAATDEQKNPEISQVHAYYQQQLARQAEMFGKELESVQRRLEESEAEADLENRSVEVESENDGENDGDREDHEGDGDDHDPVPPHVPTPPREPSPEPEPERVPTPDPEPEPEPKKKPGRRGKKKGKVVSHEE